MAPPDPEQVQQGDRPDGAERGQQQPQRAPAGFPQHQRRRLVQRRLQGRNIDRLPQGRADQGELGQGADQLRDPLRSQDAFQRGARIDAGKLWRQRLGPHHQPGLGQAGQHAGNRNERQDRQQGQRRLPQQRRDHRHSFLGAGRSQQRPHYPQPFHPERRQRQEAGHGARQQAGETHRLTRQRRLTVPLRLLQPALGWGFRAVFGGFRLAFRHGSAAAREQQPIPRRRQPDRQHRR